MIPEVVRPPKGGLGMSRSCNEECSPRWPATAPPHRRPALTLLYALRLYCRTHITLPNAPRLHVYRHLRSQRGILLYPLAPLLLTTALREERIILLHSVTQHSCSCGEPVWTRTFNHQQRPPKMRNYGSIPGERRAALQYCRTILRSQVGSSPFNMSAQDCAVT